MNDLHASLPYSVVLDFDGVLLDSLDEVALNAYNSIMREPVRAIHCLPQGYLPLFRKYRYLVQKAGDMLPLARWCLTKLKDPFPRVTLDEAEFKDLCKKETEPLQSRILTFFATRDLHVSEDYDGWLRISTPFQPVWQSLQQHASRILLVTNKNLRAVQDLCGYYKLDLRTECIYSGEHGLSKAHHLKSIMEKYEFKRLHFIDDSCKNLLDLKDEFSPAQLQLSLATWGYNTQEDKLTAERAAINLIDQKGLIKLFET